MVLVSVIIPTFNRSDLIEETLVAVLNQTYGNWECIIIDDGSTDSTKMVVEGFIARDKRFRYLSRPQNRIKGASSARNIGLENSKGDYIQFLDSDDLISPNKFEIQLKELDNAPYLSLASCKFGSFSNASRLNVKTKYNAYKNFRNSLKLLYTFGKFNEYFPPHVYLVPRKVIELAGVWNESIKKNPNDDGEYFTRVIYNSSRIVFCDKAEAYYRAGNIERLSILDSPEKIRGGIASWKLIEKYLSEKSKKIARIYVGNGKRNIFNKIKDSHPELISENIDFFQDVSLRKKWYQKLINR